mmetsp:Transcript_2649/g.9256  ORF Transcript_2649/g.9256 Transcript_2649/m.9256 type:complete len:262 (-) Transcript_2649:1244-2029(-)
MARSIRLAKAPDQSAMSPSSPWRRRPLPPSLSSPSPSPDRFARYSSNNEPPRAESERELSEAATMCSATDMDDRTVSRVISARTAATVAIVCANSSTSSSSGATTSENAAAMSATTRKRTASRSALVVDDAPGAFDAWLFSKSTTTPALLATFTAPSVRGARLVVSSCAVIVGASSTSSVIGKPSAPHHVESFAPSAVRAVETARSTPFFFAMGSFTLLIVDAAANCEMMLTSIEMSANSCARGPVHFVTAGRDSFVRSAT